MADEQIDASLALAIKLSLQEAEQSHPDANFSEDPITVTRSQLKREDNHDIPETQDSTLKSTFTLRAFSRNFLCVWKFPEEQEFLA